MILRKRACYVDTVALDSCGAEPRQAGHFAGMRCEHESPIVTVQFLDLTFKCVQPIGVEHNWDLCLNHDCANKFTGAGMTRDSRPDREHGFVFREAIEFF